jgi:sulfotransferase 6B1
MSKNFVQSTVLRSTALAAYQAYARAQFWRKGPRIFLNSLPKAGTHLLMSIFDSTPGVMNSRLHIRNNSMGLDGSANSDGINKAKFRSHLERINGGQVTTAHLPYSREADQILCELDYRTVILVRNPKDLLVSRMHYISSLKRHPLHTWLTTQFMTDTERLLALIRGGGPDSKMPSYADTIAAFVGWKNAQNSLLIKFEDIIGEKGGGDNKVRAQSLQNIFVHIGIDGEQHAFHRLAQSADQSPRSATFRKGVINDWKETFVPEVEEAYEREVALYGRALGYT